MKVEKKKGVIKIRIVEHNRPLLYFIFVLIILFGLVVYSLTQMEDIPKTDTNSSAECIFDSDCVLQKATCCSCDMGGEEKCVTKIESAEIINGLSKCKDIICPAVYSCSIKICGCNQGKCSAIY